MIEYKGWYGPEFVPQILKGYFAIRHHTGYPELEIDEDCRFVRYKVASQMMESEIFFDSDECDKNPYFDCDGIRCDLSDYFEQIGQ